MSNLVRLSDFQRRNRRVFFDRPELRLLLNLYARRVAGGEWRDYAIDHTAGMAVFSVFRHSLERPLYAVVKTPSAGGRGIEYSVMSGRHRLARSSDLAEALAVFDRPLRPVP